MRPDVPVDIAHVGDDMSARRAPTCRGRINVDGPQPEPESGTDSRDPVILGLDPNKQKVRTTGVCEQRQQGCMNKSTRRQTLDPAIEHRVIKAFSEPLRYDLARDTDNVCV